MKIYDEEETLIKNAPPSDVRPEVSIFLPVYNEEPNLLLLQREWYPTRRRAGNQPRH